MVTLIDRRAPEPSPTELFRHPSLAGTVPLMAITGSGVIAQVNAAGAKMLGYSEAELIGRHLSTITAWDSRCTNSHEQLELLVRRLGGVTTWLHARGCTVRTIVARMERISADEPYYLLGLTPVEAAAA